MRNEARKMVSAWDVLDAWLHDDTYSAPTGNFQEDLIALDDYALDADGAWVILEEGAFVEETYFEDVAPIMLYDYYEARKTSDTPLEVLKDDWDDVAVGTRC